MRSHVLMDPLYPTGKEESTTKNDQEKMLLHLSDSEDNDFVSRNSLYFLKEFLTILLNWK